MHEIQACARCEFELKNFDVYESLLGKSHDFDFYGTPVCIRIPSRTEIEDSNKGIKFVHEEIFSLGMNVGHEIRKGKQKKYIYNINRLWIYIEITEKFRLNKPDLQLNGKHYKSFSGNQKKIVDKNLKECSAISREAFQYWLRVVRWKTLSGSIGRSTNEHPDENWRVTFCEMESRNSLGFGIGHMTGKVPHPVTPLEWRAIQHALKSAKHSPVYWDLHFEGEVAWSNGDYRGATLYFAIAVESYLRSVFLSKLPRSIDREVLDVIQTFVGIRQIVQKIGRKIFPELNKGEWSTVHKLLDRRNDLAHEGNSSSIGGPDCQRFRKVSRKLLKLR